jgi:hypothetical protein
MHEASRIIKTLNAWGVSSREVARLAGRSEEHISRLRNGHPAGKHVTEDLRCLVRDIERLISAKLPVTAMCHSQAPVGEREAVGTSIAAFELLRAISCGRDTGPTVLPKGVKAATVAVGRRKWTRLIIVPDELGDDYAILALLNEI